MGNGLFHELCFEKWAGYHMKFWDDYREFLSLQSAEYLANPSAPCVIRVNLRNPGRKHGSK